MSKVVPCLVDPRLATNPKGYCYYWWVNPLTGKVYTFAHSALLAQALGRDLLPGHHAAHKCNHPACWQVHPDHVYEASQSENERDKHRPPPHAVYPVEFRLLPHPPRSLHRAQVPIIRALKAQGLNARQIADALGLNWTTVRAIANGRSYGEKHG